MSSLWALKYLQNECFAMQIFNLKSSIDGDKNVLCGSRSIERKTDSYYFGIILSYLPLRDYHGVTVLLSFHCFSISKNLLIFAKFW